MTLNFAAMLGIYKDVNISHDEFGLAGSLYYLAQLIFQVATVMGVNGKQEPQEMQFSTNIMYN